MSEAIYGASWSTFNTSSRLKLQERNGREEGRESRKWLRRSTSEHRGSTGEQRASTSEHRGSMREQRGSILTKRALADEQSGEAWVSGRSRVGLGSGKLYIYIPIHTSKPPAVHMNILVFPLLWNDLGRMAIFGGNARKWAREDSVHSQFLRHHASSFLKNPSICFSHVHLPTTCKQVTISAKIYSYQPTMLGSWGGWTILWGFDAYPSSLRRHAQRTVPFPIFKINTSCYSRRFLPQAALASIGKLSSPWKADGFPSLRWIIQWWY